MSLLFYGKRPTSQVTPSLVAHARLHHNEVSLLYGDMWAFILITKVLTSNVYCFHSDEYFIIVWVFFMKIPWWLEDFLVISHAVFVCVRIKNSIVTSCNIKLSAVLLITCHFHHDIHTTFLWYLEANKYGPCLCIKRKNAFDFIRVIPDECPYYLGLVYVYKYNIVFLSSVMN